MSSREDFIRKCGLTDDDVKAPEVKTVDPRPLGKGGEIAVDDTFIRTADLADTEQLKSSPENITSKTIYREEQLKKFREARVATMTREMGLEDGVRQHDELAHEGESAHGAAANYKAQLLAEYRKKKQNGGVSPMSKKDEAVQEL